MKYAAFFLSTVLLIVVATTESRAIPNAGVKVTTVVNNANNPSPKAPSDFQYTISEIAQPPLFSFAGSNQILTIPLTLSSQTPLTLSRLSGPSVYLTTFSGDCGTNGSFTLQPGEVKACTITQTYLSTVQNGSSNAVLKIVKLIDAIGAPGQIPLPSQFQLEILRLDVPGNTPLATVGGSTAGLNVGLQASTTSTTPYRVREQANSFSNYIPTYGGDCSPSGGVTLQGGEAKTCIVTNSYLAAKEISTPSSVLKIIARVEANGAPGPIPLPSQFQIEVVRIDTGSQAVATVPGSENGWNVGLQPNQSATQFQVQQQSSLPNYVTTFSGDCEQNGGVTLLRGEMKTCVVTNSYLRVGENNTPNAMVKIIKVMDTNGSSGPQPSPEQFDFDLIRVASGFPIVGTVPGSTIGWNVGVEVGPSSTLYLVQERHSAFSSYLPTYSGDCDEGGGLTLLRGRAKTCIVTNSYLRASQSSSPSAVLKIITRVDANGAPGPIPQASDFEIDVLLPPGNTPLATVGGSETGLNVGLNPNADIHNPGTTYVVREQASGFGNYVPIYSGDCNPSGIVFLVRGQIKTCVVTNSFLNSSETSSSTAIVNVTKKVEANDFAGTTPPASSFIISVLRDGATVTSTLGSETGRNIGIEDKPGNQSYAIAELPNTQLPNFLPRYSGDCAADGSLLLTSGQRKACVVTNTYIGGSNLNRAPVAFDQNVSLNEDTPKPITLVANDPDGSPISYIIQSLPSHGTLSGTGANLTFTPAANFNGNDSFTFQAREGNLLSNVATVSLKVLPINDAPVANGKSVQAIAETPLVIPLVASDLEGDSLTLQITQAPLHGSLNLNGLDVTYTPANNYIGADSFRYVVSDGNASSNTAIISITVVNGIVISDVVVGENNSGLVPLVFTVGLLAPSTSPVTVQYSTVNANATAGQDYSAKSGSVTIPAGQSAASITITAFGDNLYEPNEVFLINLSNPTNAVLKDGTGAGTILNDDPLVGISSLTPENSSIDIQQQFNLALTWTHPERWRLLETIDLRLVDDEGVAMWVQFHEPSNTFREINPKNGKTGGPVSPGSSNTFQSDTAVMHLQQTTVVGTGPTGPSVTINYNLSFKPKARGRTFRVEVFATDDFGHQQGFDHVGTVTVPPH